MTAVRQLCVSYISLLELMFIFCFIFFSVTIGKGGHETSLVTGNSGDPMAFGEIVRQKDRVKRVSTTRQKSFFSQVTSSRVVAPTKEGGDQLHGNDGSAEDTDDNFFKEQTEFDKATEENTEATTTPVE